MPRNQASNSAGFPVGEDAIQLTDSTADNASASQHGFLPKLPNDATKFLDGTGAFTVPTGATQNVQPLFDHFASAGNLTTGETDLYSDTVAAGQLATNGDKINITYAGTFASSATATRTVKVYFGGTAVFSSGAITTASAASWTVTAQIIRVSSTTVRYSVRLDTDGAVTEVYQAVGSLGSLTLANTQVAKITGQAGGTGAATNDIIAFLGTVQYSLHA